LWHCYIYMPKMVDMIRSRCVPRTEQIGGSPPTLLSLVELSKVIVRDMNVLKTIEKEFPHLDINVHGELCMHVRV